MAGVSEIVGGARTALGQYLGLVSVLPSVLLVAYVEVLVDSGAWTGHPDWASALHELAQFSLGRVALLALLGVAVGVVLHPLQFTMVQLLEGYWGLGRLAVRLRVALTFAH